MSSSYRNGPHHAGGSPETPLESSCGIHGELKIEWRCCFGVWLRYPGGVEETVLEVEAKELLRKVEVGNSAF